MLFFLWAQGVRLIAQKLYKVPDFIYFMIKSASNIPEILLIVCSLFACRKEHTDASQRTFRMGFQNSVPRADFNLYIQSLNLWVQRADAGMITTEVPWDSLLNGMKAEAYVINNFKALAEYYRSKKLNYESLLTPRMASTVPQMRMLW
jgi:hypothetical protein